MVAGLLESLGDNEVPPRRGSRFVEKVAML
jgi:hypothetical protein